MKEKIKKILADKTRTIPIISYPFSHILGIKICDLVTSSESQAKVMKYLADHYPVGVVFNMMDLSVEAEAFGSEVSLSEDKIPEVKGTILSDIGETETLRIPSVSEGRCSVFIEGIRLAKKEIQSIPVLCGVIGPLSLAGRLLGMTELMIECYDNPESVAVLLEKCSEFITSYILALKSAGADGVMLCEPVAGLLSEDMANEFSFSFVRKIFGAVGDEIFITGYHNCGASVSKMTDALCGINADIYHFGNAVDMQSIIPLLPKESIISGNLDPLLLKDGSKSDMENAVKSISDTCGDFGNFMLSTGCDVPPDINFENLDTYFLQAEKLLNGEK